MNRQLSVTVLREELKDAEKHLRDTSDYLDQAIQINRNACSTAHTQERVRLAARVYRLAVEDWAAALSRLQCLTVDATSEDIKPRAPQTAQNPRFKALTRAG